MNAFTTFCAVASLIILVGFVIASNLAFGWQRSYSAYAAKWTETVPLATNTHLWSIITIIVGALLAPAMIGRGDGNPWQFLGFFAPVYLFVVGFTPEYESKAGQKKIHYAGAIACAVVSLVWLTVICRLWWVVLIAVAVMAAAAYLTKTYKTSYIFWGEMAMFASVYAAVLIGG